MVLVRVAMTISQETISDFEMSIAYVFNRFQSSMQRIDVMTQQTSVQGERMIGRITYDETHY